MSGKNTKNLGSRAKAANMIDLDSSSALDELELGAFAAPRVSHALQNNQHPLVMTTKKKTRELSLKGTSPLVC